MDSCFAEESKILSVLSTIDQIFKIKKTYTKNEANIISESPEKAIDLRVVKGDTEIAVNRHCQVVSFFSRRLDSERKSKLIAMRMISHCKLDRTLQTFS